MDTDGDQWGDDVELDRGTDPTKADTDDDGLNDYEEFFSYGTDATNYDTDGDMYGDGDEVNGGFNPLNAGNHPTW